MPPTISDEISVEIVNVDVHVVDRAGKRVEGLSREAFQLFESGEPVEISNFSWVPGRQPAASGGEPSPDPSRTAEIVEPRQIAIFFDELQIGDRSRTPLLVALRDALTAELAATDRVSIVRFAGADIEVVLPWSSDRRKLTRALEELGSFSAGRLTAGQELRTWLRLLEDDIKGGLGRRQTGGCPDAGVILRGYADLVRRNVEYSAAALLRFSQRVAHQPGRKLLLHVSDGIPLVAGGEAYQYAIDMCSGEALAQGVPGAFSTLFDGDGQEEARDRFDPFKARLEMSEYVMAALWTDLTARVNALGVTVYTLQAGESGGQFLPDSDLAVVPAAARAMAEQNPVDTIALLARETGGLLIRGGRGVAAEVARMVDDFGGYYSLAFRPASGGRAGLRRIRVEVARADVELRYRRSYRLLSRDERIVGQLLELFDAERSDNALGVELKVHRLEKSGPQRLSVIVPFERLSMIDGAGGAPSGRFTVYLTLRTEHGQLLPVRQRSIEVQRTDPTASAYTYEIELPDEQGEVAIAVVDEYSGTLAFARHEVRRR